MQTMQKMLTGNQDYVRKHPVATKRAMRAILKATDFCVSNPAVRRDGWSMAASPIGTTMHSRH